ncbi:MAG: LLM class flavin-dependent oxidoreductase [Acidimicrobiia bacterium]
MRIGISTAQRGRLARPAAVRAVAQAAEQVGYSSLWVLDAPVGGDAGDVLDPLGVLAATAAVTSRARLGVNVHLAAPYDPLLLARSLTTLDVLSEGRLVVSLEADDLPMLDAVLDCLDGGPRPRPPVLVGCSRSAGLERVGARADGWSPANLPLGELEAGWARARELAADAGRDPATLRLVVRTSTVLSDDPVEGPRPLYSGSVEQVAADLEVTGLLGAEEVVLGFPGDPCLDEALDGYARIAEAVTLRAPVG